MAPVNGQNLESCGGPDAAKRRPTAGKSATPTQPQIGNYRVLERIGNGGMGIVYRAIHVELDREVALKILPAEFSSDPAMVARFKREAKAAARLHHENIVQIYDVSMAKGRQFLALEFVPGRNLNEILTKKKRLSVKRSIDILKQAVRALDHAYDKGVVHRDIKPSNFLITRQGKVKLCDLGLALRTNTGDETRVTGHGTALGTVDYMAPEQARDGRLADTRSDIYSLGCTLYQMLTGRVPFPEGSIAVRLLKHAEEPPPDPLEFDSDIPSPVLRVLNRMLQKRPEDRYQTPRELLADLESLEQDSKRPRGAAIRTPCIGAAADEIAAPSLALRRIRPEAIKKQRDAVQHKRWLLAGGTATAAVLLAAALVWLATTRAVKSEDSAPRPGQRADGVQTERNTSLACLAHGLFEQFHARLTNGGF